MLNQNELKTTNKLNVYLIMFKLYLPLFLLKNEILLEEIKNESIKIE